MEEKRGNSLPQEIVFEILKELPVKTLVRFRAVSKLWCSIIDNPVFVDSHRTRSYTRSGGIRIICECRISNAKDTLQIPKKDHLFLLSTSRKVDFTEVKVPSFSTAEVIMAFEVGPEKFNVIPLPDGAFARFRFTHIIQVGGRLAFTSVDYARAGEVGVDPLTNVKVVESLDYVEARDVDQAIDNGDGDDDGMAGIANGDGDAGDDDNEGEWVEPTYSAIVEDMLAAIAAMNPDCPLKGRI
ncbi:hypothetical protein LguiA_029085 [Lonicera macranthoides]